jgi:hypothetical protein
MRPSIPLRVSATAVRGALDRALDRLRTRRAARHAAAARRARVRAPRDEIAGLPTDIALDLRICPGDGEELDELAVSGR